LLIGPLHTAIGLGKESRQSEILQTKLKGEFDSKLAMKIGGFNDRMVWHRVSKRMVDLGLLKCVAESKGNMSARWRWTGTRVEDLVLPSIKTVRNCVTKRRKNE